MRFHLLSCLILLAPRAVTATSIVAIWTPASISVSADSKITDFDGRPVRNVCKIHRLGNLYFAFAGYELNPKPGLGVADTIVKTFVESDSFAVSLERVKSAMDESVRQALARYSAADKEKLKTKLTKNGAEGVVLSVLLFEIRDGAALLGVFDINYFDKGKDSSMICPRDCHKISETVAIGERKKASEMIDRNNPNGHDLDKWSHTLVAAEVMDSPDVVGLPIVTLHLDWAGARWISNESGCPDVAS